MFNVLLSLLVECGVVRVKRTNGNLYDPESYSNFQYHTETDQSEFVRPCIVLNHSVPYLNI